MADPLPKGQQMLLQRLLCEHCVTEERADEIFQEIKDKGEELNRAENVRQCFQSINPKLTKGFGLEIVTMVGADGEKHHAIINQHACEISKNSFLHFGPELRTYVRILLEALVEGPMVRSTLINLRSELKDPLKLDLDGADRCIQTLLEELWLTYDSDKKSASDMHAKIKIGPRAFMELAHLLTDMGYDQNHLPQFIFYR